MAMINSIGNALSNKTLTNMAEGAAKSVIIMTGVKAVARPMFIYADKKTDDDAKKYAATKEFLYQILCLGITFAMLPIFTKGGFKLAEKYINKDPKAAAFLEKANEVKEGFFKKLFATDRLNDFFKKQTKETMDNYKKASKILKGKEISEEEKLSAQATIAELQPTVDAIHAGNGGKELGSLVGSVLGLTILAPVISHEILHPIMKAIGMDKKPEAKGKPVEPFLADAKVPTEKIDTKA